jgi:hypothetical protein
MSAAQISELVEEVGGLLAVLGEATGAERAQVYASLGLRLEYDPYLRRVNATADLSRVAGCVILAGLATRSSTHSIASGMNASIHSIRLSRVSEGGLVHVRHG